MKWLLVACVVASTVFCDLLQSHGMRRGGRAWKLPLSIVFMAASFFAIHPTAQDRRPELRRPRHGPQPRHRDCARRHRPARTGHVPALGRRIPGYRRRLSHLPMTPLLYPIAALIPAGYQLASLVASLRFLFRRTPASRSTAPISILKPIRGLDEGFEAAIRSHALQDYPEFEILFGVHTLDDPPSLLFGASSRPILKSPSA